MCDRMILMECGFLASNSLPERELHISRRDETHQNQTVRPSEPSKPQIKPLATPDSGEEIEGGLDR